MPAPKKASRWFQLHWLFLLPIPLLWYAIAYFGGLSFLEHKTVDWRFQFRGELTPPVKVIYADVDSLSIDAIGNFPWSRTYFSRVAEALVKEGGAKAVGFDFVFSDAGVAESADLTKIVEGNVEFGRFLHPEPPVVLAAAYAGWQFTDINGHRKERSLPLVASDKRKLTEIEPPEVPSFRTSPDPDRPSPWSPPFVGLIDTLGNGTRVVPAFAPTASRTYFHMGLELARLYWGLPPGSIKVKSAVG